MADRSTRGNICIRGGRVLRPGGWQTSMLASHAGVLVEETPAQAAVLDASDCYIVPGFIDLQVNGGWGIDFVVNPTGVWQVGQKLAASGVTAWLPTLVSSHPAALPAALSALESRPGNWVGSEPLGWHLEGPWLNPERKGAHRSKNLRHPAGPLDESLRPDRGVRLVTLAPELPGALEAVAVLVDRGVVVSLGHSDCDVETAGSAFEAGATMGTHLFNAMSGLHHRTPGLAAALLTSRTHFGLIADGIHVSAPMVDLAWRSAGADQLILVTDMMAGMGLEPGVASLGDFEVHLDGTSARLADGTLAGSVLDMAAAVRNLMTFTGCSLADAVAAATTAPAEAIHDETRGCLAAGRRADVAILDQDINVVATVVAGEIVYERNSS